MYSHEKTSANTRDVHASTFDSLLALESRLDRMDRRMSKYFQILAGCLTGTFIVAVVALCWTKTAQYPFVPEASPALATTTELATVPAYPTDVAVHHLEKRFWWYIAAGVWT
jgi:hypothetical protein